MKVCTRSVLNETVPGIEFDEQGVANYVKIYDRLVGMYPRGKKGLEDWNSHIEEIKEAGKRKKYDCLIGVSGGTDSCWMLHLAKEAGLRPLALNFDNGWSTEIAVSNIKKVTKALDIDFETYVVNYEEMKDILVSYMKASFPWIDVSTDIAIGSILYRIAAREGIKYIWSGSDFRSEGSQPNEWTHSDGRQLSYIQKKFGTKKIKSYPNIKFYEILYFGTLRGIKMRYS